MIKWILAMIVCWLALLLLFPSDLLSFYEKVTAWLGPTGFCLIPQALYLGVVFSKIIPNWRHFDIWTKREVCSHLNQQGDVAGTLGLLGTVFGMIASTLNTGKPDMSQFMIGLISTAFGSGICLIISWITSMMLRPPLTPDKPMQRNKFNESKSVQKTAPIDYVEQSIHPVDAGDTAGHGVRHADYMERRN